MTKLTDRLRVGVLGLSLVFSVSVAAAEGTEGTPEQKKACTPDAMHLCNQYIPDAARVKQCLADHVGDLSPACREVFEHG